MRRDVATATVRIVKGKISSIMHGYPGLRLGIEGNTDGVGGDAYNQDCSRSARIPSELTWRSKTSGDLDDRSWFRQNSTGRVNNTVARRQQNRRVELVVSGEVIGTTFGSLTAPENGNH